MNITVIGLGYVGCVSVGVLADMGHNLFGVDVSKHKVDLINSGKATIVEKGIDKIIHDNFNLGRIRATSDTKEAVALSSVAIICVGTPNDPNGHLDMQNIYSVAEEIGLELRNKKEFFCIAIRSTVMPGTNLKIIRIIEEISSKKNLVDFAVVSNPEFLREGTAVKDFLNPPYTILASESELGIATMKKVYDQINAEVITPSIGSAEIIKFVNNTFHALKVDFANEIGKICKTLGINSHELMDIFVKDDKLNISPYYLRPGLPYGGSCLPKDLKALQTIAHDNYLDVPVIESIDRSNEQHLKFILQTIIEKGKKNIGFYGLSFKVGTDDLRFSPAVELAERLKGKGYNVKIYDKDVIISKLLGKNKDYLFKKIPHINSILVTNLDEFLVSLEVLVIFNKDEDFQKLYSYDLKEITLIDGLISSENLGMIVKESEKIC